MENKDILNKPKQKSRSQSQFLIWTIALILGVVLGYFNIEVLNNLGNIVDRIKPQNKETNASFGKQIVRIMEYLDSIATEENIVERQLWLPQIPANIVIEDIIHKYSKSGEQNN